MSSVLFPLRRRQRVRRNFTALLAVLLAAIGSLVLAPAVSAVGEPDFDFEIIYSACADPLGDTIYWQPRFEVTPGTSWRAMFTVRLRGDSAVHEDVNEWTLIAAPMAREFLKDQRGYAALDKVDNGAAPIEGINWATLGANPRFEITWTYGINDGDYDPLSGGITGTPILIPVSPRVGSVLTAGSGTHDDPFLVSTKEQIDEMRCHAGSPTHFRLTNDIDMSGVDHLPLGSDGSTRNMMSGVIDGDGHVISDLTIDLPQSPAVGFIAEGRGLLIQNLTFEDADIRALGAHTQPSQGVGVVVGRANPGGHFADVTVTRAHLVVRFGSGLFAGLLEESMIVRPQVDGTIVVTPLAYVGDLARTPVDRWDWAREAEVIGGLVGEAENLTVTDAQLRVRMTGETDLAVRIGGVIGYPDASVAVFNLEADIEIDLEVSETGTTSRAIAGVFGKNGFDQGSSLNDSVIRLDMTLRAPATNETVSIRDVGGVAGAPEEGQMLRSVVTGSLTIDATAATGAVDISRIGGAFGQIERDRPASVINSHVGVDVTILGDASMVGALAGRSQGGLFTDVRVDGTVTIAGDATEVGGLIGRAYRLDNDKTLTLLRNVIFRGDVSVSGVPVDVGVLFGGNQDEPLVGVAVVATNLWWDGDRNGETAVDRGLPGKAATSAQFGSVSWLRDQGFAASIWCVASGVPAVVSVVGSPCQVQSGGGGGGGGGSVAVPVPVPAPARVEGVDRFATATALSQRFFSPGVPLVYLSTGADFADALAVGPLAGGAAPVLMVRRDEIPASTIAELRRLSPGRIVVLGGTAVVSETVVAAARGLTTGSVTRIGGLDRFATAALISQVSHPNGAPVVYVATGADFADALGGGPRASQEDAPVLLVQRDQIPAATVAELRRLNPARVVVLGGPAAVSLAVERDLRGLVSGSVTRLEGADRFATSVAVSQAGFDPGVARVFLANGRGYADALAAAAVSGGGSPVLLVREDCVPMSVYLELQRLQPREVIVLGGVNAVGQAVSSMARCTR